MTTPQPPPSPTIAQGIQTYLDYLNGPPLKRAPNTIRTYGYSYGKLGTYLAECEIDPTKTPLPSLEDKVLEEFPTWMHDSGLSISSIATHIAAAQSLLSFWFREEMLNYSPAVYERLRAIFREAQRGAGKRKLFRVPSKNTLDALIAFVRLQAQKTTLSDDDDDKTPQFDRRRRKLIALRDVAMLELLRATGIRISEAVALDRGDVDYEKRRLLIDITKSKEPRSLPISDRAWRAIRVYLRERQDGAQVRALREQPLFSRHDRRAGRRPSRLTTRSVQRAIRDYARQAGLDEEELEVIVTPHKFRHRFATDMLRATKGNLGVTQKALGHQSPSVTARYVHLVDEDIDAAFAAMNTEAGSS